MSRMTPEKVAALMNKRPQDCTHRELVRIRKICGYTLDAAAAMLKVTPYELNQWESGYSKPNDEQCKLISLFYRLGPEHEIPLPVESFKPTAYAVVCSKGCNRGLPIFMKEAAYEYAIRQDNKPWTCPRCGSEATFQRREVETEDD